MIDENNFIYEKSEYTKWEFVEDVSYYKVLKNNNTYIALEVVSSIPSIGEEYKGETECRIVLKGILYFDGFRHLYIGEEGYLYYQNTEALIKLLEVFDRINKQCEQYD